MAVTVTVACKLPHGLKLRLFNMVDVSEPILGGGMRTVKVAQETGNEVTIKGNTHAQDKAPNAPIVEGFALTHGVDKEFWDAWLKQNKDLMAVKNGLIFAHEHSGKTESEAKEKRDLRSGLERLDPTKMPKGLKKADSKAA